MTEFIEGYHYTEGFHGTDLNTAWEIAVDGFNTDVFDTCLAPSDDLGLALSHAEKNAHRNGTDKFAVLKCNFPITPRTVDCLGRYSCLRFYGKELENVEVDGIAVYDANGQLICDIPIIYDKNLDAN